MYFVRKLGMLYPNLNVVFFCVSDDFFNFTFCFLDDRKGENKDKTITAVTIVVNQTIAKCTLYAHYICMFSCPSAL